MNRGHPDFKISIKYNMISLNHWRITACAMIFKLMDGIDLNNDSGLVTPYGVKNWIKIGTGNSLSPV